MAGSPDRCFVPRCPATADDLEEGAAIPACASHSPAVQWWHRADEATRQRVRAADFYAGVLVPPDLVPDFTDAGMALNHSPGIATGSRWRGAVLDGADSDALRAFAAAADED